MKSAPCFLLYINLFTLTTYSKLNFWEMKWPYGSVMDSKLRGPRNPDHLWQYVVFVYIIVEIMSSKL